MMHQTVCPIKISVVNKEHQREHRKKVKPTHFIDLLVPQGVFSNIRVADEDQRNQRKNRDRDDGIADLAQVIGCFGKSLLDLAMLKRFPQQNIEEDKSRSGNKKIPSSDQL